ncbi:hypothetical protein IHE56_14925 [Streptomyces sp. ID01-12c]|uniref:hypothetical protein n=1 Tax=Streptomyces caniscabiei TaxID=2746961 RepID=UPI00177B6B18|nr:hypothetical protein [Streptomyces caniscabiei]MBD9703350.1 hypothetical protein [Streptomyces caniscabiei]MDX3726840.1 hypothetical protein [Streptomyces caniscabiei]
MAGTNPRARAEQAARSAGRAAGYCWMEHPSGHAHCTRRPHSDNEHVDYYTGRQSVTATSGVTWRE